MARRAKSKTRRKRSSSGRKKRSAKEKKQTAPTPATNKMPPSGWNADDQSASNVVAQEAERRRRFMASVSSGAEPPLPLRAEGTLTANAEVIRGAQTIHADILKDVAEIEGTIAQLPLSGIGHNNPPEPIETSPLNGTEIDEIKTYITLLKAQPPVPSVLPTELGTGAHRLNALAQKISDYAKKQADTYVTEAVKTAGKATPIWILLGDQLTNLHITSSNGSKFSCIC